MLNIQINHIKLFFGFKDKSDKINYVKQINIVNFTGLANNSQFNFKFSVGGYVSYAKDSANSEYFSNLVKSFKSNLLALFYRFKETRSIVNRLCIYNPLFTTIPVYCFKTINFNEDKTKIIENNSIIGKYNKSKYIFNKSINPLKINFIYYS